MEYEKCDKCGREDDDMKRCNDCSCYSVCRYCNFCSYRRCYEYKD